MKKYLYLLLILVYYSCIDKKYILNSKFNPRPTAGHVFSIDKQNKKPGDLSIIDTNAIYICDQIIRSKEKGIRIYYRFFSNGNLQEVILNDENIDSIINNPDIGNVGRYKILKNNKIQMEILRKDTFNPKNNQVFSFIEIGTIKEENLYLRANSFFSKPKGVYKFFKGSSSSGYAGIALIPIGAVDLMIPDKRNCFKKTKVRSLKPIDLKY